MEPDTATVAVTVAVSDARATIVVIEDEQPGPSTFKEEGATAVATEATTATEKGEKKKEVNRKGVCACSLCVCWTHLVPGPSQGSHTQPFGTDRYRDHRRDGGSEGSRII